MLSVFVIMTMMTLFTNMDFESERRVSAQSFNNISNENANLNSGSSRSPASINEANEFYLNKEFFCNESGQQEKIAQDKVSKKMVMINFHLCYDSKLIGSINLENLSNGFVAQIFKLEENKFKTDYIQLSEGLNKLKLEVVLKDGQKHQESLEIISGS